MKIFVLVAVAIAVCSGNVIPESAPLEDNQNVEAGPPIPDLDAPVDQEFVRNAGANNQYWLFTRRNPHSAQFLIPNNINTVLASNYIAGRPTMVIVHGWNNNGNTEMNPLITSAFLSEHDGNVIVVDWRAAANSLYSVAAGSVVSVGQHLGNFLTFVFNNAGGNWNNLHLAGFSLGAHVVGNAGRQVGGRAARVTGMDPANYGWNNNPNALNRNAGQYVEAIHTDGLSFGIFHPLAHADFYPNGGQNMQPGCWTSICSHGRATELFASSIRNNRFVGTLCPNAWEANLQTCSGPTFHMGNAIVNKRGSGIYTLRTGSSWPF